MVDVQNIVNGPLKIIFMIHFFLSAWGMQGDWSPNSYLFYNFLLFITLLLAIRDKESPEPVEMCFMLNVSSILLDVIVLAVHFPSRAFDASNRFSAGMAILNLLIRPITSLALYRIYHDRALTPGTCPNLFRDMFESEPAQRNPYENIEGGVHHNEGSSSSPATFSGGLEKDNKVPPPYHGYNYS